MLTSLEEPKLIILIVCARNFSSLFYRIMLNQPNFKCYFESFLFADILNNMDSNRSKCTNNELEYIDSLKKSNQSHLIGIDNYFKYFKQESQNNSQIGHHTFLKDLAMVFNRHPDYLDKLVKTHKARLVYLVRDPRPAYKSFQQAATKSPNFNRDLNNDELSYEMMDYETLWKIYLKHPGHVVIGEDMLTRPEETLLRFFTKLGIKEYNLKLTWEPLSKDTCPDEIKYMFGTEDFNHFYGNVFSSTGIQTNTKPLEHKNISDNTIEDKNLQGLIEKDLKYYELFKSEANKID